MFVKLEMPHYIFYVKKLLLCLIYFLFFIFNISCNQGITPATAEEEYQTAGFSGTLTFKGSWPKDVKWTLLVVFKEPLTSASSFNIFNVGYISNPIPNNIGTYSFSTAQDSGIIPITAGAFKYVAVAQSKKDTLTINRSDWTVVGIYYTNSDSTQPGKLTIPANTLVTGVNITCDFNKPPVQPPGGN